MLHRSSLLCVVAGIAAALVAVPTATAARACESSGATPSNAAKRTMVRATLCTLNAERGRYGLRPLQLNKRLSSAARFHARDMVRRDYFGHDTLGGGTFVDRIRRSGYLHGARSWTVGENIAWGTRELSTPGAVTEAWMNSAGHRANILNGVFREVGIGVAIGAPGFGGQGATYATEFGIKG